MRTRFTDRFVVVSAGAGIGIMLLASLLNWWGRLGLALAFISFVVEQVVEWRSHKG
jgi:hypothetical protein